MSKVYIQILIFALFAIACEDIFESDLSDKQIVLLAPADGLSTDLTNHTFWWELIDDAQNYQLQIASPNFLAMEQLVADTVLSKDKFVQSLTPGVYEWRVRAVNTDSETEYVSRTLTVENSSDISRQRVILNYPGDNFVTNAEKLTFRWNKLFNADSYLMEWKYENGDYATEPISVENTYAEVELAEENTFTWSIAGYNESTGTYSAASERTIIVDRTPPLQPQLVSPTNTAEITATNDRLTFTWTREAQAGASEFDSLYIYKGTDEKTLLLKEQANDLSYTWQKAEVGEYSYLVKSFDSAGNEGTTSDTFTFSVVESSDSGK